MLGLVRDPKLKKTNSVLEFIWRLPEVDEMAAEGNFVFGHTMGDLAEIWFPPVSPQRQFYIRLSSIQGGRSGTLASYRILVGRPWGLIRVRFERKPRFFPRLSIISGVYSILLGTSELL